MAVLLSLAAGILLFAPTKAEAAASQFDQTFGSGGTVFYSTVSGSNGSGDIEIQPDGKAVVVGMQGFEVARVNVNGTPNTSFDGLAQINLADGQAHGGCHSNGRQNYGCRFLCDDGFPGVCIGSF